MSPDKLKQGQELSLAIHSLKNKIKDFDNSDDYRIIVNGITFLFTKEQISLLRLIISTIAKEKLNDLEEQFNSL